MGARVSGSESPFQEVSGPHVPIRPLSPDDEKIQEIIKRTSIGFHTDPKTGDLKTKNIGPAQTIGRVLGRIIHLSRQFFEKIQMPFRGNRSTLQISEFAYFLL